jgi:hypothetical protein
MTTLFNETALRNAAPAIFAKSPADHVSEKYNFVPTYEVLEQMQEQGFVPVSAQQVRSAKDYDSAKHLVRLRHREALDVTEGYVPEVILTNSHGWQSRLLLNAGIYRFVCSNGLMVASQTFGSVGERHSSQFDYSKMAANFLNSVGDTIVHVNRFMETELDKEQEDSFLRKASILRFGKKAQQDSRYKGLLNAHRRKEDEGNDVWRTLNRVQENSIRGGFQDPITGRNVRELRGIDSINETNAGVWQIAESFLLN